MKKIILSVAMIASMAFVGCSSDDDSGNDTCVSCETNAILFSISTQICDNGDGTADVTTEVQGEEFVTTIDLAEGETVQDLDCEAQALGGSTFDIGL